MPSISKGNNFECELGLKTKIIRKKNTLSNESPNQENQTIITNFSNLHQLLERLESLSRGGEVFETTLCTEHGIKYPGIVRVTSNKTKMTLREGVIGEAYIIVMKN